MIIELDELVRKIADEQNIPYGAAEQMANAQFGFVRKVIQEGNLKSVYLIKLGKFMVRPKRKEFFIAYNELKKKQIENKENPISIQEFAAIRRANRELSKRAAQDLSNVQTQQT